MPVSSLRSRRGQQLVAAISRRRHGAAGVVARRVAHWAPRSAQARRPEGVASGDVVVLDHQYNVVPELAKWNDGAGSGYGKL